MKNYINKIAHFLILILWIMSSSCETVETDLIDDPSAIGPGDAPLEFLFNGNQIAFANFFESTQFFGAQVTRMELMRTSPVYASQFGAADFDNVWRSAYSSFLIDAQLLKARVADIESEEGNGNYILASVQIMEAYVLATLVDTFGDVPYSEALQGSSNFNPGRDDGRTIYDMAVQLLEEAVGAIDEGGSVDLPNDLYYDGDITKWRALANSMLLKLAVQARLNDGSTVGRVSQLISDGGYIANNLGDFQFNYSGSTAPESRHPIFPAQYEGTAGIYMSAPFIRRMEDDPRFRYYFYLQNGTIFGREHGDAGPSVASEFNQITVHGLYPAGGKYNDGSTGPTNANNGAQGAGASIILTNFSTQFYIAEAELMMLNNIGNARVALENGISTSMSKVTNFQSFAIPSGAPEPTAAEISDYINEALARFDAASGNQGKLDVIITEFYKSLWGNGIEIYNNFRRTGYPGDLVPSISGNPGVFTNSMLYPAVYINNNNNSDAVQKSSVGQKVWWAEGTTFNLDF